MIYAYPADAPDNFGRWVTPIARDLAAVDTWWQGQDASRTLRFDFAGFPGCATQFGALDISSVRLPSPTDHYRVDEADVIDVVNQDLPRRVPVDREEVPRVLRRSGGEWRGVRTWCVRPARGRVGDPVPAE